MADALREITQKYGELDAVGLVGFHGLFATGICDHDYRLVKGVINKVRGTSGPLLFTDAGSLAAFTAEQRRLLFKIYSLFDILSLNEDELLQIC